MQAADNQHSTYRAPALWIRVGESALIVMLVPAIGAVFRPGDPFFVESGVTWLIVGPLLAGLRYGFIYGFAAGLGTVAMAALIAGLSPFVPALDAHGLGWSYAVGLVLVGMLAGEFTDVWRRRIAKADIVNAYRKRRLDTFVHSYHLLRVSHDQLTERLAANPHNLRDSLMQLSDRFAGANGGDMLANRALDILRFVAEEGRVQQCALYAVDAEHRVAADALNSIGHVPAAFRPQTDPMVAACLDERRMISLKDEALAAADPARLPLLAVVPLIDVGDRVWAVVTVHSMPFMVYNARTLHLLAVLGGNLGDLVTHAHAHPALDAGQRVDEFEAELAQWVRYADRYRLQSLLFAYEFPADLPEPELAAILNAITDQQRALDTVSNQRRVDGWTRVLVLMPLTPPAGADAYRTRMQRVFVERLGLDMKRRGIELRQSVVDGRRGAAKLIDEIQGRSASRV